MIRSLVAVILGLVLAAGVKPVDSEASKATVRLAKGRLEAARKTYQVSWKNYRQRHATADFLYLWSVRWLEAEKLVNAQSTEQLAALRGHLERMRQLEQLITELHRARQATVDEISAAEYYRTEAELWLLQTKERQKAP